MPEQDPLPDTRLRAFLARTVNHPSPAGLEENIMGAIHRRARRRMAIGGIASGVVAATALTGVIAFSLAAHRGPSASSAGRPSGVPFPALSTTGLRLATAVKGAPNPADPQFIADQQGLYDPAQFASPGLYPVGYHWRIDSRFTPADVLSAQPFYDGVQGHWKVVVKFTANGSERVGALTSAAAGAPHGSPENLVGFFVGADVFAVPGIGGPSYDSAEVLPVNGTQAGAVALAHEISATTSPASTPGPSPNSTPAPVTPSQIRAVATSVTSTPGCLFSNSPALCPFTARLKNRITAIYASLKPGEGRDVVCFCQMLQAKSITSVEVTPGGGVATVNFDGNAEQFVLVRSGGGLLVDDIIFFRNTCVVASGGSTRAANPVVLAPESVYSSNLC